MKKKKCFACGRNKELNDFYTHPRMADGHLNKCKECTKNDVKKNYQELIKDPEWIEQERARGREKAKRLGYKSISTYGRTKATREKYPEKYAAHKKSQYIKLNFEGAHRHHWSYNEEHQRDVIQLRKSDHGKAHRFLIYDQERKMYRTLSGELLDTRERHEIYILEMIETQPD